jgi:hypothetical protein
LPNRAQLVAIGSDPHRSGRRYGRLLEAWGIARATTDDKSMVER